MKRFTIIALALLLSLAFVPEAIGHGILVKAGKKDYRGWSWGCMSGRSRTYLYTHWFQSDLHSTLGDIHVGGGAPPPGPGGTEYALNPDLHPHHRYWSQWVSVGINETGYRNKCTVRTECEMWNRWKKVAECTDEQLNDGNDSTCPEAVGPSDERSTQYNSTIQVMRGGIEVDMDVHDVLQLVAEQVDPDCVPGVIIP